MNDTCLQIFAKSPLPGRVKTRLKPLLNDDQCARLAANMIRKTVRVAAGLTHCKLQLWGFPDTRHAVFTEAAESAQAELLSQQGADLGARMKNALTLGLAQYHSAVLIGTDCPQMQVEYLADAFATLEKPDTCVIGPAEDGGYVLIGANFPLPDVIFDGMSWGTDTVLRETLNRLDTYGIRPRLLPALADLDTVEDFKRYTATLYGSDDPS